MHPFTDKKTWLAKYRAAVEAIERVEARELYEMTDEQAWRIMKSLRLAQDPWRQRPDWSGLVEQQAIFHRRVKPRRPGSQE